MSRFRRERDNYKQMLDSAQKSMMETKNGDKRVQRNSISSTDEVGIILLIHSDLDRVHAESAGACQFCIETRRKAS